MLKRYYIRKYRNISLGMRHQRRKQGVAVDGYAGVHKSDTIYTTHHNNAECFYLRLLLINVCGPTSFQQLRTVNGNVCETYREACHWDATLQDAALKSNPNEIRVLFAIIIFTCSPSNPQALWNKYKDYMAED